MENRDGSEKRGFTGRTRLTDKSLHYLAHGLQSKGNKGEADISEHSGKNRIKSSPRPSALAASAYSTTPLLSKHKLPGEFLEFPEHWHTLFPHLLCSTSIPSLAWLPLPSCKSSFNIASWGPARPQWERPNTAQHTSYLGLQGHCQARPTSTGQTRWVLPSRCVLGMCD